MERIKEHKCEVMTDNEEVSILGVGSVYPHEWVLGTDYNVQVKINYCPFCGIKLKD